MDIAKNYGDLSLAQETCTELRAGNNDAILPVYRKYHPVFMGYTRRRVKDFNDESRATSIVDDFWVELLNAKAICDFQGLSSLKTYLFKILNFRIVDNVRRAGRQNAYANNISSSDNNIDGFGADDVSPEKDLMAKEKVRLVNETLLMLTDSSPTDAHLMKMHMEGLNYQEMAEKLLGNKPKSDKEIKKKTDAVKKQFTRKTSGSMAKFKSCLERIMTKNQLAYGDLLN
ncbi:RNA polymerase, sigma-24 subunit, ECF subfamily [Desulfosarcina cetonica]|uniref:RNA polymerase sigma factor n=1 Tax=Desulfosarcina cetonica TaxID=90730 RepID=UPI0006CF7C2C|nr:RNA polymerase sigma factor [Desulfosarcina cetonica]VTR66061.1 RNA polymerase, sigma-24 subunit, ECF subfamily [Desulfosarcina cetonica]